MTQPLPITPAALTKRARTILGNLSASSSKVRNMTDAVDILVGPPQYAGQNRETYAGRQQHLIEELTAQGYLAEPIGPIIVRVQRPEDVERKRQEMLAGGAADVARLADIAEPWQLRAAADDVEVRAEAIGDAVESGDVDPDKLEAQDDRIRAASDPDASEDTARVTEALDRLGVTRGPLVDRELGQLLRELYVSGWNDGHEAGLAEADGAAREALVQLRKKVMEYRGYTFEQDPAAEPDEVAEPELTAEDMARLRRLADIARAPGLAPVERLVLLVLTDGKPRTTTQLADKVAQPPWTLRDVTRQLSELGLIVASPTGGGWTLPDTFPEA